jgi:hypothetical protein
VPIVFDQEIHVHYWQFYVESRTEDFFEGLTESRGGQTNGLCGAAVPGLLFLTTGLHTGHTRITVEVLDAPAPIGDEWEDVVEASFRPVTAKVALVQWAGEASWPLPLAPIDYRVRYSATGMDRARGRDTLLAGELLVDRYLLQFWPAPPAPDAVIRQTSRCAAYWHAHARTLPSPPTPQERAEAKQRERVAREQARQEGDRAFEGRRWGGRLPDERVRRTNGALVLAQLDRKLVDGIAALDPATQRAVAVWAARRACAAAGLTDLDWVKPALAALERGESLPFAGLGEAFRMLDADRHVRRTTVASYDGRLEQHFSATRGRAGTVVRRGRRPAEGRAGVPVPRDGHDRDRIPAAPVRGARRVPRVGGTLILAVAGVLLGNPNGSTTHSHTPLSCGSRSVRVQARRAGKRELQATGSMDRFCPASRQARALVRKATFRRHAEVVGLERYMWPAKPQPTQRQPTKILSKAARVAWR